MKIRPFSLLSKISSPSRKKGIISFQNPSFFQYLVAAFCGIIFAGLSSTLYTQVILKANKNLAYSTASTPIHASRYLSFQGRLTDSSGNPISVSTPIYFKLFDTETMGTGTSLYVSSTGNSQAVTPDTNGIFSVIIGKTHGIEIPISVFSENPSVFLEVTAGGETMSPRQQIATVGYAQNSETLQGLPPSSAGTKNTVMVIDGLGNLNLGETSPTIQSISGTFGIKGQAMLLDATNSLANSNIKLDPINPNGAIQLNTNGTGSSNAIVATNANLSTGNLFYGNIGNENQGYNFINFSNISPTTHTLVSRFTVSASGSVNVGATLNAANISIGSTLINASATEINLLDGLLATNGSIIIGNGSSLSNLNAGASGYVLVSNGTTPTWVLSTSVGSTYIAGNGLTMAGNVIKLGGSITENTRLNIGNTEALFIKFSNGNVGIGTTNPLSKLHIFDEITTSGTLARLIGSTLSSGIGLQIGSSTVTSGQLIRLTQNTSTMTGAGLYMDLGIGSTVSFTGNFFDLRNNGASVFNVNYRGGITQSYTTPIAGETINLNNITFNNTINNATSYYGLNVSGNAATVASSTGTGTTEPMQDIYEGFRFNTGYYTNISGVSFRFKKNIGTTTPNTGAYVRAYLYADTGTTSPAAVSIATSTIIYLNQISSTAFTNYVLNLGATGLTANTNYWVVLRRVAMDANDITFDGTNVGTTEWANSPDGINWTVGTSTFKGYYYVYTQSAGGISGSSYGGYGLYGNSTQGYGTRGSSTNGIGIYGSSTYSLGGLFTSSQGLENDINSSSANAIYNFTQFQRTGDRYYDLQYNTWFTGNAQEIQAGNPVYTGYYYYYNGIGTTLINYSAAATQYAGSTYPVIVNPTDYFYMGRSNSTSSYRNFFFNFSANPSLIGITWEYAGGTNPSNGECTWSQFVPTVDETNGLSTNGMVTFPTNGLSLCHIAAAVGNSTPNQYWFRVSAPGGVTIPAYATASNWGMFSGYFNRFYSAGTEKYRVNYDGYTYTAGPVYPGGNGSETSLQTSRYLYDTGSALGTNSNFYVSGNLGVGISAPIYQFQTTGVALIGTKLGVGATSTTAAFNVSGNGNITSNLTIGSTITAAQAVISSLSNNQLILGGGAGRLTSLGTGATNQVLHGNPSGAPTWGAVLLGTETTGNYVATINSLIGNVSLVGGTDTSILTVGNTLYINDLSTLQTVTGRGATTTTILSLNGGAYFPGSGIWNASGSVGIGTTSPTSKLTINGDLSVGTSAYFGASVGITGNLTISNAVQANSVNVSDLTKYTATVASNTSFTVASSGAGSILVYSPFSKILWHDKLAFSKYYGVPTFETYDIGTTSWGTTTPDLSLFSQQENQSRLIIDGVTKTAARWTWNNTAWSFPDWWAIGVTFNAVATNKNFLIESSTDGITWTTRHTSNNNTANANPVMLKMTSNDGDAYIRLTITINNAQPLRLSTIRALSSRWGDQGGGSEQQFPYLWDASQNIAFGPGAALGNSIVTIGTNTTSAAGGLFFGNDTNLYRSGASQLKTDDSFSITGSLGLGTTAPLGKFQALGGDVYFGNGAIGTTKAGVVNARIDGNLSVGGTIFGDGSGLTNISANSMSFDRITSGTNTGANMIVGAGASLTYTGTGVINASQLQAATWASPLAIGTGVANTGKFTSLWGTSLGIGYDPATLSGGVAAFNGSVGIGTTNPQYDLDIYQSTNLTSGINITNSNINAFSAIQVGQNTTSNYSQFYYNNSGIIPNSLISAPNSAGFYNPSGVTGGLLFDNAANAPIIFATGGTNYINERMRITGSGSIGIGTSNPGAYKLNVSGSGYFLNNLTIGGTFIGDGSGLTNITANSIAFDKIISGTNLTATMVVGTGASLSYTGTGVINASQLQGTIWASPLAIGSSIANTGLFSRLGVGATSAAALFNVAGNGNITGALSVGNSITTTNIYASGAIGIGNTTPGVYKLNVTGAGYFSNNLQIGGTFIGDGSGLTRIPFDKIISGTNVGATMVVGAGASLSYTGTGVINASQLIGANWASPLAIGSSIANTGLFSQFGVGATSAAALFNVVGNGNITAKLSIGTTLTSANIYTTGSVGIGSSSPNYALSVGTSIGADLLGNFYAQKFLDIGNTKYFLSPSNSDPNKNSLSLYYGGSIKFNVNDTAANSYIITAAASRIQNFSNGLSLDVGTSNTGNITWNNSLFLNMAGNVGIGTTNPLKKLDLLGDLNISGTIYVGGSGTSIGTTGALNQVLASNGAGSLKWINAGSNYAGSGINLDIGGSFSLGGLITKDANLFVGTSGSPSLFIQQSTGNVGIGTSNPTSGLEVFNPAAFDAAGDVEIGYNLNFSNDTASYIRSQSPLYIEAGDPNSAEDLVLRSRGSGNVIIGNSTTYFQNNGDVSLMNGNLGIGTFTPGEKLQITNGDSSYALFGPNSTWGGYLRVGSGLTNHASGNAAVSSTNGNLHLDAGAGQYTYLNYYSGSGIYFGSGASGLVGSIDTGGNLSMNGTVTAPTFSGNLAWTNVTGKPIGNVNWPDPTQASSQAWSLAWRNYYQHMIVDMSNSTAPNGTGHNNTNAEIAWSATYPTIMGWNGSNTYGVRVDSARISDSSNWANGSSVSYGALRTATNGQSASYNTDFAWNDYSFFPNFTKNTCSGNDPVGFVTNGATTATDTVGRIQISTRYNNGCGGGNFRFYYRYMTASDHPTIWVRGDSTGKMDTVYEGEDPIDPGKWPENPNPFEGNLLRTPDQYYLSPPPLSLTEEKSWLSQLPSSDQNGIIKLAKDYFVTTRKWTDVFNSLDDINLISDRYQPAARFWIMRFVAKYYGIDTASMIQQTFLSNKDSNSIYPKPNYSKIIKDYLAFVQTQSEKIRADEAANMGIGISPDQQKADLAEWYTYSNLSNTIEPGDLLSINPDFNNGISKSSKPYDPKLIGVVSTSPDQTMGKPQSDNDVRVALTGRVPVKISSQSPSIKAGDPITSSSEPGKAMLSTKTGQIIGKALEDWTPQSGKSKILVFLNLSWYDPDMNIVSTGQVNINYNVSPEVLASLGYNGVKNELQSANYNLKDSIGNFIDRIGQFKELIAAKINTGLLLATNIISDRVISNTSISQETKTNLISPLSSDDHTIIISADASVSGKLIADSLQSQDATISGTLYADNIISNQGSITDLMSQKIASLRDELKKIVNDSITTGSDIGETSSLLSSTSSWSSDIKNDSMSLTGDLSLDGNLMVKSQAAIKGVLIAGSIAFKDNFIETTDTALYLQPSSTGSVHILGDTLVIADTGDVTINGKLDLNGALTAQTASFSGSLFANLISTHEISTDKISVSTDSAQTIIAQSGFAELATSSAQLSSNATAGTATLPAGKTELVIQNNKLTSKSMVYLTPVGSTQNQVVYVKSKFISPTPSPVVATDSAIFSPSTFVIALDKPLPSNIDINWWIIN